MQDTEHSLQVAAVSWLCKVLVKLLAKAPGGWLDLVPVGHVLTLLLGHADSAWCHQPTGLGALGDTATFENAIKT